ncbi:MAG: amidohydrolase [Balneolaceae bacterium]|nr:MAG: amidohydrolase [Balneolaceae bacterium]
MGKHIMLSLIILAFAGVALAGGPDRDTDPKPLPIIDMHLHANPATNNGPPPNGICPGNAQFPDFDPDRPWIEVFLNWAANPPCDDPVWGPETNEGVMQETLEVLRRRNIYGVTSGPLLDDYIENGGDHIIPSLWLGGHPESWPSPDSFRSTLETGKYKVFGEIGLQYLGMSPDHPSFEPYLEILEEMGIPLGIHIGTGPPGVSHFPGSGGHLARMHSALEIEPVIMRHPRLQVYLMHAGWPMIDDLLAVFYAHPQVYADLGIIIFALPKAEIHYYLRRIVQAGFGRRVMFGSDQMNWPGVIEYAIDVIESADFLTETQKRDILYNNAARFLRLSEEEIARHHGR